MSENRPRHSKERVSRSELACDDVAKRIISKIDTYEYKLAGIDKETLRDVSQDMYLILSMPEDEKVRLLKIRDTVLDSIYHWLESHVRVNSLSEPNAIDKTSRLSELATEVLNNIHSKLT